jgi:SMP-30/Gluconolactonase/LRE-like region
MSRGMWFANGSVITGDGVLLVDETFGNRVSAFDIEADGGLANRRTWAQFGEFPTETDQTAALPQIVIAPDGCCLDADGALWIADGLGGRLIRVREGGEIVEEIAVGSGVFACMLGGADGRARLLRAGPPRHPRGQPARDPGRRGPRGPPLTRGRRAAVALIAVGFLARGPYSASCARHFLRKALAHDASCCYLAYGCGSPALPRHAAAAEALLAVIRGSRGGTDDRGRKARYTRAKLPRKTNLP